MINDGTLKHYGQPIMYAGGNGNSFAFTGKKAMKIPCLSTLPCIATQLFQYCFQYCAHYIIFVLLFAWASHIYTFLWVAVRFGLLSLSGRKDACVRMGNNSDCSS